MSFASFWVEMSSRIKKSSDLRRNVPSLAIFEGTRKEHPVQFSHSIFLTPVTEDFDMATFDDRVSPPEGSRIPLNRAKHIAIRTVRFEVDVNDTDPVRQLVGDGRRVGLFEFVRTLRSALLRDWKCYSKTAQGLEISITSYNPQEQLIRASFSMTLTELEVIEDERIDPALDPVRVPTEGSIAEDS